MKKLLKVTGILILSSILASCGGRAPNPVMIHQYGDEQKSCKALEHEIRFIEQEIRRMIPQTKKTAKNVGLGVAGYFLLVPLFFMDFSDAEKIEIDALRQRYNHLVILAEDKGCGLKREQIPEFQTSKTR